MHEKALLIKLPLPFLYQDLNQLLQISTYRNQKTVSILNVVTFIDIFTFETTVIQGKGEK